MLRARVTARSTVRVALVAERLRILVPSSLPDALVLVVGDAIAYRCAALLR